MFISVCGSPIFLGKISVKYRGFHSLTHSIIRKTSPHNQLRQDYGYKDGSYVKTWEGREDNEHLAEIVQSLDATAENFSDQLYEALKRRYPSA
ncbi:hypothetical protein [Microbulbifer sp. HZ11]|uniref:hypothetical protein n=1 Tax=Microbulbifer sp. HZ11 TaxID=1453501 RepID=UPI000A461CA5